MIELGVGIQGNNIGFQVDAFEALIGVPVDSTRAYQNWSDPLIDKYVLEQLNKGKHPLIAAHAFEATSEKDPSTSIRWADITKSLHDDRILSWADELKSVGTPLWFVFHHEPEDEVDVVGDMTGPLKKGQGRCGTAAEFVAAWKYVKHKLRRAGVPKTVKIGVCLMGGTYRDGHGGPNVWIPSTMNADFYATDGYSRDESSGQKPKTFPGTFGDAYNFATARGKPLVIEESGCAEVEGNPAFKANWFKDAAALLPVWKPALFMYSHVLASNFGGQDYRINTSPEALVEFKKLVTAIKGVP